MKEPKMTKSKKRTKKDKQETTQPVVSQKPQTSKRMSPMDIILKINSILKRIEDIENKLDIKK